MKKINHTTCSGKDRIVCVSDCDKLTFWYQAAGDSKREYLFEQTAFSSVKEYFKAKGHRLSEKECYLTIAELHRFREYHNKRLTFTMERIPREVKRVLTANIREKAEREPAFADDRVA